MTAEDKFRRVLNERLRGRGLRVVKLKPISNPLEQSLRRVMPWGVVKLVEHTSCTRAWDTLVGRFRTLDDVNRYYP